MCVFYISLTDHIRDLSIGFIYLKKKKNHIKKKSIFSRLCLLFKLIERFYVYHLLHYSLCLLFRCFSKSLDKTVIMQFLTRFLTE